MVCIPNRPVEMLISKIHNLLENNKPFAFARFNDGEIGGLLNKDFIASRGAQIISLNLKNKLLEALTFKSYNYWVGIPCPVCYPEMHSFANNLLGDYEFKTLAVELINRNYSKFIIEIVPLLKTRNIHWVGGTDQNLKLLLLEGFNIISHTKVPTHNAFSAYEQIRGLYVQFNTNDVVIISAGPLERVLVYEWFKIRPDLTILGLGSTLDPWTRGVWHRYHNNTLPACSICN